MGATYQPVYKHAFLTTAHWITEQAAQLARQLAGGKNSIETWKQ